MVDKRCEERSSEGGRCAAPPLTPPASLRGSESRFVPQLLLCWGDAAPRRPSDAPALLRGSQSRFAPQLFFLGVTLRRVFRFWRPALRRSRPVILGASSGGVWQHAADRVDSPLAGDRGAGGGRPRRDRPLARRARQRALLRGRGGGHLPRRLPLLLGLHRGEGARARRHARDARRAARRRPRLRAHEPLDRARAPLRRHRRPGPARRPDARRAVRLPARHALADRRRRARRLRAGLRDPVLLAAPRRQLARPDGARRGEPPRRRDRHGLGARDHGDPARRAGARGGQRAQALAVGRLHHRRHDPDRDADGRLPALLAAGTRARGLADRPRAGAAGGRRRAVGRALGPSGRRCSPSAARRWRSP